MNNRQVVQKLVDRLYLDVVGYNISFEARKKLGYHDNSFTYGEIMPASFIDILEYVNPKKGEVFVDLGSGTGKAVMVAAMAFDFKKAIGVEYLPELHEVALRLSQELKKLAALEQNLLGSTQIEFVQQDFLKYKLAEADLVFAHATCFQEGVMNILTQGFEKLKKGSRVIAISKQIKSPYLTQIGVSEHQFNWGQATTYTYYKNS